MSLNKLPQWYPQQPAIYDIHKTYLENAADGPFFSGPLPKRAMPPKEKWIDFLGHSVASPIGVAAGPLLTSRWVDLAGKLGFDIPIYKTIRSTEYPCHPLPNMVFVDTHGMIKHQAHPKSATLVMSPSPHLEDLAVTNSFGMPSKSPQFLIEDIPRANASLQDGQVMVVSVGGTVRSDCTFLEDFVKAAELAKNSGAKIIEANFSCPNIDKSEGCLYMTPATVFEIGKAIVRAVAPIPVIIKAGIFSSEEQMRDVFIAAARAGIRAVAGINTVSMAVIDEKGQPALGPKRLTSGICGGPIREVALQFVETAAKINRREKLDLTLIGVGGITLPEHFDLFFNAGADVAMSATGMMWDPYLAARYHQNHAKG
ncbi:MAG: tRNA-dihydrouridine synthase [Verrucomicrobia bacterium]|nr:tRNA-dihydrouridine synthase [Verrucomicrobiota bacterium]